MVRRINATKWPDKEKVVDASQGVQLVMMQELARHWGTDYDWRKTEAKLNALPQLPVDLSGMTDIEIGADHGEQDDNSHSPEDT
ncbi:epoxide hydrolase N-terminal domain-containing protein [Paenibacillus sp. 2TAB19]|uniref:epoxide hydrolase N-terminal domain-containing protein n=1 Tax=Paenibacillus sp. 2TAB19 TaxID=3233003 RepID=UPI003F9CC577